MIYTKDGKWRGYKDVRMREHGLWFCTRDFIVDIMYKDLRCYQCYSANYKKSRIKLIL